jgi:serine/threonine-protein phosphatase 2A regulatory subunit A
LIKLQEVLGVDMLTPTFITVLEGLTKDGQWRVRESVFSLIGDLGIGLGKDAFVKHLETMFLTYLTDTAASVRNAGIRKAKELGNTLKSEWVMTNFVPKVIDNFNVEKQGYLSRMCSLFSLASVITQMSKDNVTTQVVPLMAKACKDSIPNVKFTAAKLIKQLTPNIDSGVFSSQLKP